MTRAGDRMDSLDDQLDSLGDELDTFDAADVAEITRNATEIARNATEISSEVTSQVQASLLPQVAQLQELGVRLGSDLAPRMAELGARIAGQVVPCDPAGPLRRRAVRRQRAAGQAPQGADQAPPAVASGRSGGRAGAPAAPGSRPLAPRGSTVRGPTRWDPRTATRTSPAAVATGGEDDRALRRDDARGADRPDLRLQRHERLQADHRVCGIPAGNLERRSGSPGRAGFPSPARTWTTAAASRSGSPSGRPWGLPFRTATILRT